ncbi:MAG: TetR/AcrR family transcriptional regulator [Sumerlaeia bacterium]
MAIKGASKGRQKDPQKREAIIQAAQQLFMANGFDHVSMQAIAQEAGVSKVTVYSHFKDKEDLFKAIVIAVAESYPVAKPPDLTASTDFPVALETHGLRLYKILSSAIVHSVHRMLMANPDQMKKLAVIVYDNGPHKTLMDLADLLERGKELGYHSAPDCIRAADQLFSMWKGMAYLRQEFGIEKPITQAKALENIRSGIEMLLRAYPAH